MVIDDSIVNIKRADVLLSEEYDHEEIIDTFRYKYIYCLGDYVLYSNKAIPEVAMEFGIMDEDRWQDFLESDQIRKALESFVNNTNIMYLTAGRVD